MKSAFLGSKIAVVCVFALGVQGHCAEFTKVLTEHGADLIGIAGDLVRGDEKKFIALASSSHPAVVLLHSRGGNLAAGIEIGKTIHSMGFTTLVLDKLRCTSACAMAWLGGSTRFMTEGARIGFHASSVRTYQKKMKMSVYGNAMIGDYLSQLGLPISAILYATQAPPEGIHWLTFSDAERVGIAVKKTQDSDWLDGDRRKHERTGPPSK